MNERIEALKALATKEVWSENQHNGAPEFDGYELDVDMFAQLIAQESIVDFYRRYLDICSDEDITIQVERYVKEHFGVEEQVTESNELHTCPYAEEIHHDYDTLCDCDEEQTYQCSRDI